MVEARLDAYIVDSLMPDLVGHDRRAASFVVYLLLHRLAFDAPMGKGVVALSHQGIADATGLSRSAVQAAVTHLNGRKLIATTRAHPTALPKHRVLRPWRRS